MEIYQHKIEDIYNAFNKDIEHFIADGLPIPLYSTWKNISIDLSGGTDSAILAYLLCKELKRRKQDTVLHIINGHRCWSRKPWQKEVALRVINWLKNYHPNIKTHSVFVAEGLESKPINGVNAESIQLDDFKQYIDSLYHIDMKFNTTSALYPYAPDEFIQGIKSRNRKDILMHKLIQLEEKDARPFLYTNKEWIIKQYVNNDILDLLDITRSCEGKKGKDRSYPQVCNNCYWCLERNWALEQNGLQPELPTKI